MPEDQTWTGVDQTYVDNFFPGSSALAGLFDERLDRYYGQLPDLAKLERSVEVFNVQSTKDPGESPCENTPSELWIRTNSAAWRKSSFDADADSECIRSPDFERIVQDGSVVVAMAGYDNSPIASSFTGFAVSRDGRPFQWFDASATDFSGYTACRSRFLGDPSVVVLGEHALVVSEKATRVVQTFNVSAGCLDSGSLRVVGDSLLIDGSGNQFVAGEPIEKTSKVTQVDDESERRSPWYPQLDGSVFATTVDGSSGKVRLWGLREGWLVELAHTSEGTRQ